ncbi:MAG: restriction endonuclease subunit S [Bacteroidaceae bacterium]|nr:restriction endonuclease subunit S [Bacteroidaceae bacterium]
MTEWKTYKIGDIGKIITGKTPKTAIAENYGGDIPFLTPSDDLSSKFAPQTIKTLTQRGLSEVKNCLLPTNAICVSCIGSDLGKVVRVTIPTVTNQQFNSIIPNEDFDSDFVYYLMTVAGKELNYLSKTSTAVPIVNKTQFSSFEFKAPPLAEQRRIAGILGAIDDKIENNRRINTNLELQAQALYKQWFVDSSTVKLGDVVKTTSGGTPSRSHMEFYVGKYGWVKSKELNSSFITKTEETITDDAIAKSAAKLLPAKSILIAMYGATVGQYAILSQPMTCNQAVCALLPNENYPYTYLFMVAKNIKEELANKAIGSAQQNISQVIIKDIDISCDIEKIKQFHKIVCPHFEVMEKNQKENETLATLRDTILPKLMNGEIKVAE